jgi:2-C-methyl-D-erythritol 4-phosphate cytidylyltransferase / 2-C-methyl-D-erythritol 2,4-cyclodiphosphate synthase
MKTAALIVAAGKGLRTGADLPKQYARLAGKALVRYAVERLSCHPAISGVFTVIGEGQNALLDEALGGITLSGIIIGGAERQDSVRAGLEAIAQAGGYDAVLIHDAARPIIPAEVIDRLVEALATRPGAVPALPVVDTLAMVEADFLGATVDRSTLIRVQTPQAFRLSAILDAHRQWQGGVATDDAQMARAAGHAVAIVEGSAMLEKITHADDLARMEAQMNAQMISRTGMGYDVHRLETGEELWLCGVKLEHTKGLSGHSDADVALHALVDALLGAAAVGDIGSHFPPSDPQWKGAASSRFVEHARDLIAGAGGVIDHVDLTIICEAPKIGPHREAMRARLASLLQVKLGQISIKATTTERLGFTGREEGIAAQAVATIRMRTEL